MVSRRAQIGVEEFMRLVYWLLEKKSCTCNSKESRQNRKIHSRKSILRKAGVLALIAVHLSGLTHRHVSVAAGSGEAAALKFFC